MWSAKALEYGGRYLRRAVADADDLEARGIDDARRVDGGRRLRVGGRAHPARVRVSDRGLKHEYQPPGYPDDHPFVPHGHSVIVTAPAAFRFTYEAMPERHHQVAELLAGEPIADPGPDTLPDVLRDAHARHRRAARDRRARLHRGRRAGAGRGRDEAAAPARRRARARWRETDIAHILNASMTNW